MAKHVCSEKLDAPPQVNGLKVPARNKCLQVQEIHVSTHDGIVKKWFPSERIWSPLHTVRVNTYVDNISCSSPTGHVVISYH